MSGLNGAVTTSAVLWGAFVNPQDMTTIRAWEARVGRKMSLAHHAQGWANGKNADGTPRYASLPSALINQHWAEGRLVMLDWGSWNLADTVSYYVYTVSYYTPRELMLVRWSFAAGAAWTALNWIFWPWFWAWVLPR